MKISTISIILTLFFQSLIRFIRGGLKLYEEGEYEKAIQAFEVEANFRKRARSATILESPIFKMEI